MARTERYSDRGLTIPAQEAGRGDRQPRTRRQFSVVLTKNWRLIFEVDHDPIPRLDDGGIDLDKVSAIRFIEVVDYHKK